jgi:hypothetical protein
MCCCIKLTASDITLSSGGNTSYNIIVKQAPIPAEVTAANELAKYLKAATGAEFKIVKESNAATDKQAIYVGQTEYAAANGVDFNKLGQEEWVIKTTANGNLILSGGRPRGTLYAVYEFLENNVGCHWLDETNEVVPAISQLKISSLNIQSHPYFQNRQIFDRLDWYPVSCTFKTRNKGMSYVQEDYGWYYRIGGVRPHHTFYDYSNSWPKNQSELYSLNKDGKRLVATNGEGPGQICMTNPEARQRVLARLKEFIVQNRQEAAAKGFPAPTVYDISQNDNDDKCVCENCKAMAEKEGSYSGPLLDFINYIADNIKNEYPDIYIRTFAYTYSTKPPKNIKAADNVIIHMALLGLEFGPNKGCRDNIQKLEHPDNKLNRELIENWSKKAANLAMWEYWVIYPPEPEPYVNISTLQPNMVFNKAKNVKYIFAECEGTHTTSFFGLKRYLGYKLMQNPDRPAQPVIDEFMSGYYGKAAPVMQKLLTYMEKRQAENKGPVGQVDVSRRQYLDLNYFKTTLGLLDQAEKLVDGNAKLTANIRRERVAILAGLFMRWRSLGDAAKQFDRQELLKQFRTESLATINYYFPDPDTQAFRKEALDNLEKDVIRFEKNSLVFALPAQFKYRNAVDLPWTNFRLNIGREKLIEDKDAVGGKAVALGKDIPDKSQNGATGFGIYDWNNSKVLCSMTLKTSDIQKDEKYHLLKVGRVNFVDNAITYFYASTWEIRCDLYRIFPPGSSYDVYVSVKFQGPEYVKGSTKENSIMVDRIIFVN